MGGSDKDIMKSLCQVNLSTSSILRQAQDEGRAPSSPRPRWRGRSRKTGRVARWRCGLRRRSPPHDVSNGVGLQPRKRRRRIFCAAWPGAGSRRPGRRPGRNRSGRSAASSAASARRRAARASASAGSSPTAAKPPMPGAGRPVSTSTRSRTFASARRSSQSTSRRTGSDQAAARTATSGQPHTN